MANVRGWPVGGEGRTEPPYSTRQFTASLLSAGASKGIRAVDIRYGTQPLPTSVGVAAADLRRRGRCRPPPAPSYVSGRDPRDQRFTRTGTSTGTAR